MEIYLKTRDLDMIAKLFSEEDVKTNYKWVEISKSEIDNCRIVVESRNNKGSITIVYRIAGEWLIQESVDSDLDLTKNNIETYILSKVHSNMRIIYHVNDKIILKMT